VSTKIGIIAEGPIGHALLPPLLSRIAADKAQFTWPVNAEDVAEIFPIRKRGHGGVLETVRAMVKALDTQYFDHACFVILLDRRTHAVQDAVEKLIRGKERFILGNNDGGQFFTPRQVIKAMVRTIDPKVGETIYDPGCGTGGFLAQSFEYIKERLGNVATAEQLETLKQRTFWGREKENLIYPIALANLVLHGIDKPNLWHGNTLTGQEAYGGLFEEAPALFDVILTNPPFGPDQLRLQDLGHTGPVPPACHPRPARRRTVWHCAR